MKKGKPRRQAPAKPDLPSPIQHPGRDANAWSSWLALHLVLLVLLAALPYSNTLSNQFALDDVHIIVQNPLIRGGANVGTIFTTHYWSQGKDVVKDTDTGLYRPFTIFTYAVDHAFWELEPAGYHFSNLLLHAVATLLVYLIARDVLRSPMAAFGAASIFAVHPIHTEAVSGIVGRAEVLATIFFLLAFWLSRKSLGAAWRGMVFSSAAALCYLLGMFSKETAVTLPAVLLVHDWMHREDIFPRSGKKASPAAPSLSPLVARYALFGLAVLVYFAFRSQAVRGRTIWVGFVGVSTEERVLTASRVLLEYVGLLVFPRTLSAEYWYPEVPIAGSPLDPLVLLSLLLWVLIGVSAIVAVRRAPALFFSMTLFFVTILPVSNLFFPIGVGKAERLLYLPSVGFCLCAGWVYGWAERMMNRKWLLLVPLVPLLSVFALRTYNRNADWKDDLTLALATLQVSPTSPIMNTSAAIMYRNRGQPDEAIPLLQEAIRQRPTHAKAHFELALTFSQKGLLDQAVEEYRQAITWQPDHVTAHEHLGVLYFNTNRIEEAIKEFHTVLPLVPNPAGVHNNLGTAYMRKGLPDKAIEHYKAAIGLKPDFAEAYSSLAAVYIEKNQLDEAIKQSSAALRLNPKHAEAHNNLGTAYLRKGLLDNAIEQYQQALQLRPSYPDAKANLDVALKLKSQGVKTRQ